MRGILIGSGLSVGWLGVSFLTENLFPVGDWRWGITAALFFMVAGIAWAWPSKKRETQAPKRERKFSDFDMPALAAVEHMKQTVAHAWDSPDKAERDFWQKIHEQMRAGRLRVIGAEVQGGPLRRISKRTLANLLPVPMNVPESDTAPYGVGFVLIDEAKLAEPDKHRGPLPGFFDLRVRSRDLYRLWPRTRSQNGGGK